MTVDSTVYEKKPRHYALQLVSDGVIDAQSLLEYCINYLSHDDVKDMLDKNGLSPRFLNDEEDDTDSEVTG